MNEKMSEGWMVVDTGVFIKGWFSETNEKWKSAVREGLAICFRMVMTDEIRTEYVNFARKKGHRLGIPFMVKLEDFRRKRPDKIVNPGNKIRNSPRPSPKISDASDQKFVDAATKLFEVKFLITANTRHFEEVAISLREKGTEVVSPEEFLESIHQRPASMQ